MTEIVKIPLKCSHHLDNGDPCKATLMINGIIKCRRCGRLTRVTRQHIEKIEQLIADGVIVIQKRRS